MIEKNSSAVDHKVAAIHRLRVNVKSLAAEARIIRNEVRRAGAAYRKELDDHRRGKLREEARYAQLALAYVRGRPYQHAERSCRSDKAVDPRRLWDKVQRFYSTGNRDPLAMWLGVPLWF